MFYSATIDELKEIIYGGFRESETHINKNDYCLITK